mmetsp:Transcript_9529/g.20092  ORF Transcript_9529/g.20092 Transcript_9529/m.20092 type:complete len:94 (-) Transcript_9529:319-600(-)
MEEVTYEWNEKFCLRPDENKRKSTFVKTEELGGTVKRVFWRPMSSGQLKRASKESSASSSAPSTSESGPKLLRNSSKSFFLDVFEHTRKSSAR